jgi:hypothetical protein
VILRSRSPIVALAFAPAPAATHRDLLILALMGCVQLGTGCLLAPPRRVSCHTELGLRAAGAILGPLGVGR